MNILVFGSNGQLGSEIIKQVQAIKVSRKNFKKFDFSNLKSIDEILKKYKPQIVINCAAFTNVDDAEIKKKKCKDINSKAVKKIAIYCKKFDALLVHFSTDYIFNGKKNGFYYEYSKSNPINYYGKTKFLAEQSIIKTKCKHIILRISWIYNLNKKNNFIYKVKKMLEEKKDISLPLDQFGSPTSAKFISYNLKNIINLYKKNKFKLGVYNLAPSKPSSRYDVGHYLLKILNSKSNIKGIRTKSLISLARRPTNSKLSTIKIEKALKYKLISWKQDLSNNLK